MDWIALMDEEFVDWVEDHGASPELVIPPQPAAQKLSQAPTTSPGP